MPALPNSARTAAYRPALAWFAAFGALWVFLLVTLGAFTTTIGAGMAFPDWPLSNGSINPPGWLTNLAMFAEHSHRLTAIGMGIISIILAIWLWRTEARWWLRKLGYFTVALVVVQGVVGGLRVLCDRLHIPTVDTSVGRLFAMLHACLAQAFACTIIAVAVACSRSWIERPHPVNPRVRRIGIVCCVLFFVQLAIAAIMRHSFAGLAIPTFPRSTPSGGWLPTSWDFHVAIHFAHRVMALVLGVAVLWLAVRTWFDRGASLALRCGASVLVSLLTFQILLGANIIWTQRAVAITTGHVLVGAATLATAFWMTWVAHRDVIETP